MIRAYKYRIYPTKKQEILLSKTFGCCRKVWNDCVAVFREDYDIWKLENLYGAYVPDGYRKMKYRTVKQMKCEYSFLSEISAGALCRKIRNFEEYRHQKFSRGKEVGVPKFKTRKSKQSFSLQYPKFSIKGEKIRLEKMGWIKFVESKKIPEKAVLKSITVSRNCAGQYFASVCCDTHVEQLPKTGKSVGIDLGLKDFAVTSDSNRIANPRYLRENQAKVARLQMWQAKKRGAKKGETKSRRWLKLHGRINRVFEHIANQRANFLHYNSTMLVRQNDVICIEDLNVAGMMKNHKLAKSIGDVSWAEFRRMLEYKCKWYGKELRVVDRFYPSSKTCSHCGHVVEEMPLDVRMFACPECGLEIDRDYNAAINICSRGTTAKRTLMDAVTNPDEVSMSFNNFLS